MHQPMSPQTWALRLTTPPSTSGVSGVIADAGSSGGLDLPSVNHCSRSLLAAQKGCNGSGCRACVASLDEVAAGCVDSRCSLGVTARGAQFLQNFHAFRHAAIGSQCANSSLTPPAEFQTVPNVLCRSQVPPPPPAPPDTSSRSRVRLRRKHLST